MTNQRTHVGIIGGGLAGLSSAVELASQGLRVTLIEANRHLGGKMNVMTAETDRGRFHLRHGARRSSRCRQVFRGIVRASGS